MPFWELLPQRGLAAAGWIMLLGSAAVILDCVRPGGLRARLRRQHVEDGAYVFWAITLAGAAALLGIGLLLERFGLATLSLLLFGLAIGAYVVLAALDDILFKRAPKPDGSPEDDDTPIRAQDGWHQLDADRGEREGLYQPFRDGS